MEFLDLCVVDHRSYLASTSVCLKPVNPRNGPSTIGDGALVGSNCSDSDRQTKCHLTSRNVAISRRTSSPRPIGREVAYGRANLRNRGMLRPPDQPYCVHSHTTSEERYITSPTNNRHVGNKQVFEDDKAPFAGCRRAAVYKHEHDHCPSDASSFGSPHQGAACCRSQIVGVRSRLWNHNRYRLTPRTARRSVFSKLATGAEPAMEILVLLCGGE